MSAPALKIPERVIFRVTPALYAAISEQAESANRSINGEICMAVDSWLYQREALLLMKDRLLASASAETIGMISQSSPTYAIEPDTNADNCKTPVRFKESVSVDLRAAWEREKLASGPVSLNSFLKTVVAWWLTYSWQLAECAKAFHNDFKNSVRFYAPAAQFAQA